MPDYLNIVNEFVWQTEDQRPKYPRITEILDYLYSLYSKKNGDLKKYLTKQVLQQLIQMRKRLESLNYFVFDKSTLINDFCQFYDDHYYSGSPPHQDRTAFGGHMAQSSSKNAEEGEYYIFTNFLKSCKDDNYLRSIGILNKSTPLPREFDKWVVIKNLKDNGGKDIDGNLLVGGVGGHVISDMELLRMTDEERDIAAREEGIGNIFEFNKNCRTMSAYHNNRMKVLRLSEYLENIDKSDDEINALVNKKYDELRSKEIVVRGRKKGYKKA